MTLVQAVSDQEQLQLACVVGYCAEQLQKMRDAVQQGPMTSGAVDVLLRFAGLTPEMLAKMSAAAETPDV